MTSEFGGVALDNGVLYYQDGTDGHIGLYARQLDTGHEQLISGRGQQPSAAGGVVVWSVQDQTCSYRADQVEGPVCRSTWSLHVREQASNDTVITSGAAALAGYHTIGGSKVVWAELDGRAHIYEIEGGVQCPFISGPASSPILHSDGEQIVFTQQPAGQPLNAPLDPGIPSTVYVPLPERSSIGLYNTHSGVSFRVIEGSTLPVTAWGLIDRAAHRLADQVVFTVGKDPRLGIMDLYMTAPAATGLQFNASSANDTANKCVGQPLYCGQVDRDFRSLADYGGIWRVNGVHFGLPQYGINWYTLEDGRYRTAITPPYSGVPSSMSYWLDKATDYLLARSLRVYVKLPYYERDGSITTPTSYATLADFASRANSRGMRLGLVIQSSDNADMVLDPHEKSWLQGLVDYFRNIKGVDWTPTIAYISASNEINNYCGDRALGDCYDTSRLHQETGRQETIPGRPDYVFRANRWVKSIRDALDAKNSNILLTVGITTELAQLDGLPEANAFFRVRSDPRGYEPTPPALYQSVDFLSPHNYAGGAVGIEHAIRKRDQVAQTYSAVVLEEYGFPTDPVGEGDDRAYREGCANNPSCIVPSASYYVEENARAIRREVDPKVYYAGGVAFMIADDDHAHCGAPIDLFTGLFATAASYCGGTSSTGIGQPKATAFRVRTHHYYYR